jgi:hypothetical protein
MNTMGKILVILVLVLSVLVLGSLGFVAVASANWQKNAAEWKEKYEVVKASAEAWQETAKKLTDDVKKQRASVDFQNITSNSKVSELEIALDREKKRVEEEVVRANVAVDNKRKSDEEAKRLHTEVALLAKVVKKREGDILNYQTDIANYRNQYLAADNAARGAVARAQNLLSQLKEKELVISKLKVGPEVSLTAARDPSFQNPPSAYVKGSIQKVHATDKSLVEISVGSDAGLDKDHTLEVFRLSPSPTYLGRLRIVEVYPHQAVGRLIRTTPTTSPQAALQPGDEVASRIVR